MISSFVSPRVCGFKQVVLALCLVFAGYIWANKSAAAQRAVGLELILAIDSSSSVSLDELFLQTACFASAFRDEYVIDALTTTGGIAVAAVQWGG